LKNFFRGCVYIAKVTKGCILLFPQKRRLWNCFQLPRHLSYCDCCKIYNTACYVD